MTPPVVDARALVRDPASLLAAALTVALVSAIGAWALGGASSTSSPKAPTHMHCPACHDEIIYNPKWIGKKCTECADGGIYKATVGSLFDPDRNDVGGAGTIILFVLTVVVALQGLAFAGMWRLKMLRVRAEEAHNRPVMAQCPFCKRKVAYSAARAGTWTTCFQCKTAFALPAID
jgi:ribosomal protein L37AE/L43A